MRPYLSILSTRFRMLIQYRAAAIAGLATQIVFGWIIVMVYEAFYAASDRPQPIELAQVITFIWLGQAFLANLPWNVDRDLYAMLRDGSVAYELCRPIDLYRAWFAQTLAWRTAATVLRAVPMFALALGLFGMRPPGSVGGAALFVIAICNAFLLSSAITMLMNVSLLWTLESRGVYTLMGAMLIFSGQEIPLPLMPGWLARVSLVLPLRGLVDTPFRIYIGHIAPSAAWPHLLHQVFWIVALVALGRWLMGRGLRRLVLQGG